MEAEDTKQPIGKLFNVIEYNSVDDLDTFISSMNHEQSIYCLIQACQFAYERLAFNILESEVISKAIRKISLPEKEN